MHKVLVALTQILGGVAMTLTMFWGLMAIGWTGDLFAKVRGWGLVGLLLMLLLGPFSIYPAALLGRRRPLWAGAWLLFLGIIPLLMMLAIPGGRSSGGMGLLVAASIPPCGLGLGFVQVGIEKRSSA